MNWLEEARRVVGQVQIQHIAEEVAPAHVPGPAPDFAEVLRQAREIAAEIQRDQDRVDAPEMPRALRNFPDDEL